MNSKHLRAVKTGSVSPEDQTHWRCIAESLKDSLALYCWVQVLPDRCVAASTLYAPQRVRHVRVVMLHVGGYCRRGEDGDPAASGILVVNRAAVLSERQGLSCKRAIRPSKDR